MFCKECGAAVADGVKFCGSCGIKVEDVPMEAPASASDQTAQAIPPEKKTTEQNYWDKLNPTQRKGHIYGIPFFILMAIAGVTLKNTAKDSPQNSPAIDDAISRSWVSFKSVDNNFALILDASPELKKDVKEYIERAVHGGLAKDSIKKIGNNEIIDRIKYAKLDNIVTGDLALIVLMPVLGPGFDNLVTWYKLDGMKATDGERKTVNGKDIKVGWGGPVEITVVPDGNNDKAVTLGGEPDPSTLGGQATPAPAVAPIPTVAQPQSPAITREEAVNNWVEKNGQQEWGLCSATSIEIRAATAGTASDFLTRRLNMVDGVMRMARVRLTQKGISSSSLDNIQQAAFDANKAKDAKAKALIFNNCVGTLSDAAQGK